MWYEMWEGGAIATAVRGRLGREDRIFEHFPSRLSNQVDNCADRSDAGPAAAEERIRRPEPVRGAQLDHWSPTRNRSLAEPAETRQSRWSISIASILAGPWLGMRRRQETRRINAAWETIDDRTLKDIGISRYELERARNARGWS